VPLAQADAPDGEEVIAYARPYELDISTEDRAAGIAVKVNRVL
jgi:hypothetical protein